MEPSQENRLRQSVKTNPPSEPLSPTLYLAQNGVLVLEDDRAHLEAVTEALNISLKIPTDKIVPVYIQPTISLESLVQNIRGIISQTIRASGSSFGGIVSDFQISPFFSSLDVWRAIEESIIGSPDANEWLKTCRILMTASETNSPEINHATKAGIIDACIGKPFGLTTLRTALAEAIHRRVS